jgi:hypothetical protein
MQDEEPLYKKLQREAMMKLQGIRWVMGGNIRIKSCGGVMYDTNEIGTLRRTTPRKGKKVKRTCKS